MTSTQAGLVLRHIRDLAARKPSAQLPDGQLLERFTSANDATAFEALLERHGAMVLGVCRRLLRDPNDAEDAFQATFCVLAQKARSVRRQDSIGGWLYQVACNAALKARARTATRQRHERRSGGPVTPDPLSELTGRELLTALDEEMQRLPERLRAPLVLCYLEGHTRDEAARELGMALGTLKHRLEEGKTALRKRLLRRGLALPAALLASVAATSAVSAHLAAATAQAAAGTFVSASVAALVRSSLRVLSARVPKTAGAILIAMTLIGVGLWGFAAPATPPPAGNEAPQAAPKGDPPAPRSDPKPAADEKKEKMIRGRVLDPDGKSAVGAKVFYLRSLPPGRSVHLRPGDRPAPKVETVTDADGRFSFPKPVDGGALFVTAPGCGPAWVCNPGKLADNPLQLAKDDVAVAGRVLDLQGQPVAGTTIRVHALKAPKADNLDKWLEAVKGSRDGLPVEYQHLAMFAHIDLAHFFPPIATDKDGRFEIKGLGRERVVALIIEGETIETREINVVTRPGIKPLSVTQYARQLGDDRLTYCPPTFDYAAGPGRVVSGVVRDKTTGKPVAGAVVRLSEDAVISNPVYFIKTTTDAEGRYRLSGLPRKARKFRPNDIIVLPPEGRTYLALHRGLPQTDTKPAVFDFDLPRGVWFEGQVKDKVTGRGVPARLGYFVFGEAPNEAEARSLYIPAMAGLANWTDEAGKFRIVVAPYRGMIGARIVGDAQDHYRIGIGADKIEGGERHGDTVLFRALPQTVTASDYETLAEVKPAAGAKSVRCDLLLDPGRTVTVQVRGPDGKPLAGAQAHGQFAREWWGDEKLLAEFPLYGLEPGKDRTILLRHPDKNLVARCEIRADEKGPVAVTLQPAAAVTGKLVDDNGLPRGDAAITVLFRPGKDGPLSAESHDFRTGADGVFRIDGLLPGMIYSAQVRPQGFAAPQSIFERLSLKAGESKDLGAVKPKRRDQ